MSLFVKICGLRDAADVAAATDAGANAVGFVFAESVRRVTPAEANLATRDIAPGVRRVAVMRHPTKEECDAVLKEFAPDVVQTDIAGQIGFAINECRFVNQSQFGVRIASVTPNALGKAYFNRCEFENCATGIVWDGTANGRTSFLDLHDCRITGAGNGVEAQHGGTQAIKSLFCQLRTHGL